MAHRYSVEARNAGLDARAVCIGPSPVLKIFGGNAPEVGCVGADPNGLLVTMALPKDWMAPADGGVKQKTGTWSGNASSDGEAKSYRIYDANEVCHAQGDVSAPRGGGQMILDNPNLAPGQAVTVQRYSWTAGNS